MRSAKTIDFWNDVYSTKNYSMFLESIDLEECMGYTGTISFNKGITAFCGLNGVGKSTIISCVKKVLGITDDSLLTKNKAHGINSATVHYNGNTINISSENSAVTKGIEANKFTYVDSNQTLDLLKEWKEQSNLAEYLNQFEPNSFSKEQLEDISWLIGKEYNECKTIETDEEKNFKPVFFEVYQGSQKYTSNDMGLGEHLLLYVYYILNNIKNGSILIFEEPESYISVLSQKRLMDYLAKISSQRKVSIIITTHSPHILTMIKKENIRIVGNVSGKMIVSTPDEDQDAKEYLGINYQDIPCSLATVFVEDYVARLFIEIILDKESSIIRNSIDIVSVDGCEGISKRLSFNDSEYMSHRFLGIYDEDMKERLNSSQLKWPYLFLPVDECVEKEIKKFIIEQENANLLCTSLNVTIDRLSIVLSKRAGEDHHDWFLDVCKDFKIENKLFLQKIYDIWKQDNREKIDEFLTEFEKNVCVPNYPKDIHKTYATM